MPGFLLHVGADQCPMHACRAGHHSAVAGARARRAANRSRRWPGMIAVAGCPFQIPFGAGTKPQPCVTVKWTMPSTRFLVSGQPALLLAGTRVPVPASARASNKFRKAPPS